MSIVMKIAVLIIMIVGLIGIISNEISFFEFTVVIYGGFFLYLLGEAITLLKKSKTE